MVLTPLPLLDRQNASVYLIDVYRIVKYQIQNGNIGNYTSLSTLALEKHELDYCQMAFRRNLDTKFRKVSTGMKSYVYVTLRFEGSMDSLLVALTKNLSFTVLYLPKGKHVS